VRRISQPSKFGTSQFLTNQRCSLRGSRTQLKERDWKQPIMCERFRTREEEAEYDDLERFLQIRIKSIRAQKSNYGDVVRAHRQKNITINSL
jgi:hypothetical protein